VLRTRLVLVDEAYYHFCGETVMNLVGKVPNLIVARTFSKAYGLAGCGWECSPHP